MDVSDVKDIARTSLDGLRGDLLFRALQRLYRTDLMHASKWRATASEDFDFYNGHQWADEDLDLMKKRGRPHVSFNRIAPLINAIVGSERNNKREVQFIPRTVGKAIPCELLTGAAEWFRGVSFAEYADSEAFKDCVICGMGWTSTQLSYDDNPDGDPHVMHLDPLKMVWDSSSVQGNLKDAKRLWYVDKKPLSVAREMFPGVSDGDLHAGWASYSVDLDIGQGEDREIFSQRQEVTIIEARWFEKRPFYRVLDPTTGQMLDITEEQYNGIVKQAGIPIEGQKYCKKIAMRAFLGNKLLEPPSEPLVPTGHLGWECITGYQDKKTRTYYGVVRAAKDPQRWSNRYFSQVMHLLNVQAKGGIMVERGAFEDDYEAAESWAQADSITFLNRGALADGRIREKPTSSFPQGFFDIFVRSTEAINQVTGLSPEFIGTREVNQAGVLEAQRRQSSLNLLADLYDSLRLYRHRQGKIILYLIQEHLSDGRLVRIAGEDNAQYVPLTREQVTSAEYDIIVDDAPNSPNEKERTFAMITQLMPFLQNIVTPDIMLDLLKYSPLPSTLVASIQEKVQAQMQQPPPEPSPAEVKDQLMVEKLQQDMDSKQRMQNVDLENKTLDAIIKRQNLAMAQAQAGGPWPNLLSINQD